MPMSGRKTILSSKSYLNSHGTEAPLVFVCKKHIPKLGSGVQELLGIKHELLEVSDVANAVLN